VADRVTFTPGSADRIAKVVRIVEAGNRDATGYVASPRLQGGGGGASLKLCTFTGSWSVGSSKTLTLKNQTTTPNTVTAYNLHLGLEPVSACDVLIGKAGTAWYLVQANLTKQPNYDGNAGTQVFTIETGDMKWSNVESCPDDEASPQSLSFFYG
jgi:hypothetical protein